MTEAMGRHGRIFRCQHRVPRPRLELSFDFALDVRSYWRLR